MVDGQKLPNAKFLLGYGTPADMQNAVVGNCCRLC
jgi:hypothetical protein